MKENYYLTNHYIIGRIYLKSLKELNLKDEITLIKKELQKLKINPDYKDNLDLIENLKNLNKQLNKVKIESIKKDKSKNIIQDKKIGDVIIREQILKDFPLAFLGLKDI